MPPRAEHPARADRGDRAQRVRKVPDRERSAAGSSRILHHFGSALDVFQAGEKMRPTVNWRPVWLTCLADRAVSFP